MAALIPSTFSTESAGSMTWYRAAFTVVNNGDTWTSGITAIYTYFGSNHTNPSSQGKEGINLTQSNGVFTVYVPEATTSMSISILAKQV